MSRYTDLVEQFKATEAKRQKRSVARLSKKAIVKCEEKAKAQVESEKAEREAATVEKGSRRRAPRVSRMQVARDFVNRTPDCDSRTLRAFLVENTGCSAHSARAVYSSLKKAGVIG